MLIFFEMSLGLAYLASYLQKYNFEVEVLDANALMYDSDTTAKLISDSDADIIGITCVTIIIPLVYNISKKIKEFSNDKITQSFLKNWK